MRTEELIAALAADARPRRPVAATLAGAVGATGFAAALAGLAVLGVRPDLGAALDEGRVLVKHALPPIAAMAAFGAAQRLARPGASVGAWGVLIALVGALALLALVGGLRATDPADWGAAMRGTTGWACLPPLLALSLPLLAASLWALGAGATSRPGTSGALAGLLAGSGAATIYALHCPEDSPLYYVPWYALAILAVTAAGAVIGRRWLRW
jgi:hypothetical protein